MGEGWKSIMVVIYFNHNSDMWSEVIFFLAHEWRYKSERRYDFYCILFLTNLVHYYTLIKKKKKSSGIHEAKLDSQMIFKNVFIFSIFIQWYKSQAGL